MNVRKAKLKDVSSIANMGLKLGRYHLKYDPKYMALVPNVLQLYKKHFARSIHSRNSLMLIAEVKGKIIAYCLAELGKRPPVYRVRRVGYISDVYVEPSYRRKGISKKFLEESHNWFKEKKLNYSELAVYEKNKGAVTAYKKAGYLPILIRKQKKLIR